MGYVTTLTVLNAAFGILHNACMTRKTVQAFVSSDISTAGIPQLVSLARLQYASPALL